MGERGAVGFGTATPWLTPAPSVDAATGAGISVADEERDGMILPYYRELIRLRGQYPVISEGSYTPYALDHERVFGYLREHITKGQAHAGCWCSIISLGTRRRCVFPPSSCRARLWMR